MTVNKHSKQTNVPDESGKTYDPYKIPHGLSWSPLVAVLFVVVTYIISQAIAQLVIWVYPMLQGWTAEVATEWLGTSTYAQFVYIALVEIITMALLYWFLKKHASSFRQIGLVKPQWRDPGVALLAVIPYLAGYVLLLTVMTALFPAIDAEQEQQIGFANITNGLELFLVFLSLAVLPPIVEEIVMRGLVFTSLLKKFKFLGAAIITSVIFGIAHLQFGSDAPLLWVAAIDTFILSMVLCYLRFKTGSLWPCIILHGIKNSLAFTFLFFLPFFGIEVLNM